MMSVLEAHAREVTLDWGVVVASFSDPAHYPSGHRLHDVTPVRRWRVRLPSWFPKGSWLDQPHAYESLAAAIAALEETGTLAAIDTYWHAQQNQSRARQGAFSKIMAASNLRDKSYDDLLRERHLRERQVREP